jgi:hypothetical protein
VALLPQLLLTLTLETPLLDCFLADTQPRYPVSDLSVARIKTCVRARARLKSKYHGRYQKIPKPG